MLEMHTLLYIIYHIDWRGGGGGDPSARGEEYHEETPEFI